MCSRLLVDQSRLRLEEALREVEGSEWGRGRRDARALVKRVSDTALLDHREFLDGEEATALVGLWIKVLNDEAARRAIDGYGRFRWLWYMRRMPSRFFDGITPSTEPYERSLFMVLATSGAPSREEATIDEHGVGFPIDRTIARRLIRRAAFTQFVSHCHSLYRLCAKGARPRCRSDGEYLVDSHPELRRAVEAYDSRQRFPRLGTGGSFATAIGAGSSSVMCFYLVANPRNLPTYTADLLANPEILMPGRYHPSVIDLSHVAEMTTEIGKAGLWDVALPAVFGALSLLPWLAQLEPRAIPSAFGNGYWITTRAELERLYEAKRPVIVGRIRENLPELADSLPPTGKRLTASLLEVQGEAWPLVPGPIAFADARGLFGLDLCEMSHRMRWILACPRGGGQIANTRAGIFERATQRTIDATSWRPSEALRSHVNKKLRVGNLNLGEFDAVAERGGIALLVSCKSIQYTREYDAGQFSVVRNAISTIRDGLVRWDELLADLSRQPHGDNYDLSQWTLMGVVVTPVVFFVPVDILDREVAPGLRTYVSLDEFRDWLEVGG